MASFDPNSDFSISIAEATTLTGFSFGAFSIDTTDFANSFTGSFYMSASGSELLLNYTPTLLGDVNGDGSVDLLDVSPFVNALAGGPFVPEADINQDGVVNLLDVQPFVALLSN